MSFKRSIGTGGLLFAALAGILGSGWLFGPFFAAKMAGPSAILAWMLGGGLMMIVALTFAELSSTFPVAGGSVRFLQLSHGPLVSFTMAWVAWLSSAAVAPIETMALLQYVSNYVPGIMHKVGTTHLLSGVGITYAAVLMLILCMVNAYGVKLLAKTNNIVVLFKLLIPIITMLVLFSTDFHISNIVSHGFFAGGFKSILASLPLAGVIFSFIGYSPAIQLAGEAKNPQRSVPIAIIGALLIGISMYVLLEIVFIGALQPSAFSAGWGALDFQGAAGPFAGMAVNLGITWLAVLILIGAIFSPFGTALIYTASAARMCYAMGENGYLPQFLRKLNKHGIPVRIIMMNYIIGLLLFLPFPSWQKMVGFLVSALVLAYAVGPIALLVLRKTMPNQHRPFRLPIAKPICLLAFYICNLIIYWTGWYIVSKMFIAILLGYLVLIIYRATPQGRRLNFPWAKSWWIFVYIGGIVLITYLGVFGGGLGVIPFGWDFLAIAIFSWAIFELSQKGALSSVSAADLAALSKIPVAEKP